MTIAYSPEFEALRNALAALQNAKPPDRGDMARRYTVTITEVEKALGYFWAYVERERVQQ